MSLIEIEQEDFIKGLRLLKSRSSESADELKKMLDYYCAKQLTSQESKKTKDVVLNAFSALQNLNQCIKNDEKKRKLTENDDSETDIEDSEISDSLENCSSCKQKEISLNNILVTCSECSTKFHQECHKPIISKKETDPRSIWYCIRCRNSILNKKFNNAKSNKMLVGKNLVSDHSSNYVSLNPYFTPKETLSRISPQPTKFDTETKTISNTLKRIPGKFSSVSLFSSSKSTATTNQIINRSVTSSQPSIASKSKSLSSGLMNSSMSVAMDKRLANMKKNKLNSKFS